MRRKKVFYGAPRTDTNRYAVQVPVQLSHISGMSAPGLVAYARRSGKRSTSIDSTPSWFALIAVSIGRFPPMPHVRLVMVLSDVHFHL